MYKAEGNELKNLITITLFLVAYSTFGITSDLTIDGSSPNAFQNSLIEMASSLGETRGTQFMEA